MRFILAALCIVSLLTGAPVTAQAPIPPVLQVAGPATPGAIVGINLADAAPAALGIVAYGYTPGQRKIGSYATLGILPAGFMILGTVSSQGTLYSGLQVPEQLPAVLHGMTIYFQGLILRLAFENDDLRVIVDTTEVQSIVLQSETDPWGVVGDV